ncbi:MAG: DNA polymerase IV [Bacilli bacterium]|nr:DNA polymerase IV [Bacilli bacterium]
MERIIFHIDVNNAFLSWTAVDLLNKGYKYDIRNSYAIIGGDEEKRHGIVLAKSSSAKKLGIITGETLYSARSKCRVLKIYPPDYYLYQKMSKKLFDLLYQYTDDIEIFSIDECFLDYTKIKHIYKDEILFAKKLKDEIETKCGFTVNIGIGNNKLCAKMASDFEKPNKIHTLYSYEIKNKMFPLDVGELFGIGKKSTQKLKALNINTIEDLACYKKEELYKYFKNQAYKMIDSANGIDNDIVKKQRDELSSISNSTTLQHDVTSKIEIYQILEQIADNLGRSLRQQKKYTNVIAVQLKDCYFKSRTHQKKLLNPTNSTDEIYLSAKQLADEMYDEKPIRLIGMRLDNLISNCKHQVSLFEKLEIKEDNTKLEKTVDELKKKFGSKVISKASLNNKKITKKYLK